MNSDLRDHRTIPFSPHLLKYWIGQGAVLGAMLAIALFLAAKPAMTQNGTASASPAANVVPAGALVPSDAPGAPSAGVPDLSGMWEPRVNNTRQLDQGQLTPEGIKMAQDAQALVRAGHTIQFASRWCHYKGVPFMMGQSPPHDIIQTKDEIAMFSEQISSPRHIYTDGRSHPDPKFLEPTTNGHSIGHWEGDTLVVDTIGFNDHGILAIPGGGTRTHNAHLVEHFHLAAGGTQLIATYTWEDSTLAKPHSYETTYFKMPQDAFPFEDDCDASDTTHWLDHSTTEPQQQ